MSASPKYRLCITLASGTRMTFAVSTMPRNWKSWLMQQCPYGTVFAGCTFTRELVAATGEEQ